MNDEHKNQTILIGAMIDRSFYYSIAAIACVLGVCNGVMILILINAIEKTCG